MRYLLDTNVCIKYLNENLVIRRKLETIDLQDIAVCAVVGMTSPPAPLRSGEGSKSFSPFPSREGGWGVRSVQNKLEKFASKLYLFPVGLLHF